MLVMYLYIAVELSTTTYSGGNCNRKNRGKKITYW